MFIFYQPEIDLRYLTEEESYHCIKVLRLKERDLISLADGKGNFYKARISQILGKQCKFEILETKSQVPLNYHIHLALAPTKNIDRTEWFLEKAIEFGVDQISFIRCQRSERKEVNLDRLNRIAVAALKQSMNPWMPNISSMITLKDFLISTKAAEKFIAYLPEEPPPHLFSVCSPNTSYCVLIGPEGDFSDEEVKLAMKSNFNPVTLGTNRLRTETAGIAACHILKLKNL